MTLPEWVDVNGEEKCLKVSLRVRARRNAILPVSSMSDTSDRTSASRDVDMEEGAARELESIPMERELKRPLDEALTHMIELGMEVEESQRFS